MAKGKRGRSAALRNRLWRGSGTRIGALLALIAAVCAVAVPGGLLLERAQASRADAQATPVSLRITELMSENRQTLITDSGAAPDWIEIANLGDAPVRTDRWLLTLASDATDAFRFPAGELAPGQYLLVYAGGRELSGEWCAPFKLGASGGDALMLYDARGRMADAVELPELSADVSWRLCADGAWERCQTPSPGAAEPAAEAAEGGEDPVEITEAMSGNTLYCPDEDGDYCDYVEIHNRSGERVDLTGWYLSDDAGRLKRWRFPELVLEPDEYRIVYCSGKDRDDPRHLHADFRLSSDGEGAYLSDDKGRMVSRVQLPPLAADQAWSLCDGVWGARLGPTPGRENTPAAAAQAQGETFANALTGVQLSEIMASAVDQPYDWLELYNASTQAVDLGGYGLSDDPGRPRRWQFAPGTVIQPGEYLGVYLTGDPAVTSGNYPCADFALGLEGGCTVCLSDPDGHVLDAAYLGQQYGGVSLARFAGESGFHYCAAPTPLAANAGEHYFDRAPMPEASMQGGLHTSGERFTVELRAPEGCRVYYTLDCSEPDEGDMLYSGPIEISGTTILRSRAFREGSMPSYTATQSFLYDVNVPEGVYVVSLVSDPDGLYSDERGILVKGPNAWDEFPYGDINEGANFWMDWERAGNVELFAPGGALAFGQPCGIKLHGQFSRASSVKAFKIFARNQYGKNRFEYPIFSQRDYDSYQSFLLRASGQDYNMTFMRDSVLTRLAKDTSLMYQESELGVCYLNGEYYSLFNLRERVSRFSVCQFEGWEGMEDQIDLVKANDVVKEGSNQSMEELLDWIAHNDVTTQAAYDYISQRIDVQNYIEYMAIEIFSGNGDTLNVKRYRNAAVDGRWRWVLYDLDWAFLTDSNSIRRWLTPGGMGTDKLTDNSLFIACMKNPVFADQFLTYFGQQMATNFTTQNLLAMFEERLNELKPLLPDYLPKVAMDEEKYAAQYEILTNYAKERPHKMLEYFDTVFHFSQEQWQQYFGDAIAIIQQGS